LIRSLLKEERGFSLMESIIAIILLTLAILPMVSMFDMGLHGVTANSHYDKARTLANLKLEQAKSLPFADVENNFPAAGVTTPYDGTAWFTEPGADFANLQYTVKKRYMTQPPTTPGSSVNFTTSGTATDLIRVTVTVRWSDGANTNTFTTNGLVAR
jgi:Tfp pilus assembly protein PilV